MDSGTTVSHRGATSCPRPSAQGLNAHKDLITELYWHQDRPLNEVMCLMETQHGFKATKRQYKGAIEKWKLKKNITRTDMRHINRISKRRREHEGKTTQFQLYGRPVPDGKIERANQRNALDAGKPGDDADTPSYILYDTPSVYYSCPSTPRSPPCSADACDFWTPILPESPTPSPVDFVTPHSDYPNVDETALSVRLTDSQVSKPSSFLGYPLQSKGTFKLSPRLVSRDSSTLGSSLSKHSSSSLGKKGEVTTLARRISVTGSTKTSYTSAMRSSMRFPDKGWWRALLEHDNAHHTSTERIVLRLSDKDLGYWPRSQHCELMDLHNWLRNYGYLRILCVFVKLVSELEQKASRTTGPSQTLNYVRMKLKELNCYELDRSSSPGVEIYIEPHAPRQATPEDSAVSPGPSYELGLSGWSESIAGSSVYRLTDLVFDYKCDEESTKRARWLLDHGSDAQEAFKGSIVAGRIRWLKWLLEEEPSLLKRSLMQNVPGDCKMSFEWDCPVHSQSCGYGALHFSIQFAAISITEVLLQSGAAEARTGGFESCSPLGIAIRLNRLRHVGFLLQWGFNVDEPCCGCLLPIELACVLQHREIFVLLLRYLYHSLDWSHRNGHD